MRRRRPCEIRHANGKTTIITRVARYNYVEFILKLKLGHSEFAYYIEKFGEDPRAHFTTQLKFLVAAGFAMMNESSITLTRAGLLQVDRLLHEFFLPHHRQYARYT